MLTEQKKGKKEEERGKRKDDEGNIEGTSQ